MNKKNKLKAIVAFAVALAFILPTSAAFANETLLVKPVMSVLPATQTVNVGNSFTVDVYIDPKDYLISGADMGLLSFDETVIQADSMTFKDFFGTAIVYRVPGTIDNVNGEMTLTSELTTPFVGVGTANVWITVDFTAVGLGTSPITMVSGGFPDENGNKIEPITIINGEVIVEPIYYALDITVVGMGTVTQDPLPDKSPNLYVEYTSVELNATPDNMDWTFKEWQGDLTGNTNPDTIFMDSDKDVTAVFTGLGWESWMVFRGEVTGDIPIETDTVVFGEYVDALDGIDNMDVPKPPSPGAPCIYAYIEHDLPGTSHDILWNDFRFYDDGNDLQVWDLVVETDTTDGSGEKTVEVTIIWDRASLEGSKTQYDNIGLYDGVSGNLLKDMKIYRKYVFTAGSGVADRFEIRCTDNHAPVAYPDSYETLESHELNVLALGVLENDYDEDGDTLTAVLDTPVSSGTLTLYADGSFDYMPVLGFYGTVTFKYQAYDDMAYSNIATVTITVVRLNRISIKDGWNLFSIPVGEDITKTTIIVKFNNTDYTWADAITAGIILGFTYGWDGLYTEESTLVPGEGYWMWAYEDCYLLIPSNVVADNHITYLDVGWNLVGVHKVDILKLDVIVQYDGDWLTWTVAVGGDVILDFIYLWNRASQTYMLGETFKSSHGYWVYAYQGCALKEPL